MTGNTCYPPVDHISSQREGQWVLCTYTLYLTWVGQGISTQSLMSKRVNYGHIPTPKAREAPITANPACPCVALLGLPRL